ncbi:MAG: type II toxin-antitoxin system RelE/ParE family toxin [Candidatus Paceibacterota bacterium]
MKIYFHPRFAKSFSKLSTTLKARAIDREKIFRINPFNSSLDTHKLHGKLRNQWSFSVNRKCRIIFEFVDKNVIFLDIGDHSLYQ